MRPGGGTGAQPCAAGVAIGGKGVGDGRAGVSEGCVSVLVGITVAVNTAAASVGDGVGV